MTWREASLSAPQVKVLLTSGYDKADVGRHGPETVSNIKLLRKPYTCAACAVRARDARDLSSSGGSDLAREHIADAAHALDQHRGIARRFNLAAKPRDMPVDRPVQRRPARPLSFCEISSRARTRPGCLKNMVRSQTGFGQIDADAVASAQLSFWNVQNPSLELVPFNRGLWMRSRIGFCCLQLIAPQDRMDA